MDLRDFIQPGRDRFLHSGITNLLLLMLVPTRSLNLEKLNYNHEGHCYWMKISTFFMTLVHCPYLLSSKLSHYPEFFTNGGYCPKNRFRYYVTLFLNFEYLAILISVRKVPRSACARVASILVSGTKLYLRIVLPI